MAPPNAFPLVLIALIGWRIIYRIRRNIGRQKVQPKRLLVRIIIYSAFCALVGFAAMARFPALAGLGAGLIVGIPLAVVGLKLTQFEMSGVDRFYTPNPYIGIAISTVLVARLAYRMMVIYKVSQAAQNPQSLGQSPLTLFLFGMLAGYYIAYYGGVLRLSPKTASPPVVSP